MTAIRKLIPQNSGQMPSQSPSQSPGHVPQPAASAPEASACQGPLQALGAGLLAAALLAGTVAPAPAADQPDANDAASASDGMSVQEAWSNAKQDWRKLQAASGDAASAARQEFEESWDQLQRLMSEQEGTAPPPDDPEVLEEGEGAQ